MWREHRQHSALWNILLNIHNKKEDLASISFSLSECNREIPLKKTLLSSVISMHGGKKFVVK